MPPSSGVVRRQLGKANMKRIRSLILALLFFATVYCNAPHFQSIAVSYVNGAWTVRHSGKEREALHADVLFSDLPDEIPAISLEIARTEELLFRIETGELRGKRALDALIARKAAYREMCTETSIAYVRYCFDVTNASRKQAYDAAAVQLDTWNGLLIDAELMLSEDPAIADRYDKDLLTRLRHADSLHDTALKPLLERERELVGAYETLAASFTVSDGSRDWTKEEILTDETLSYASFTELYDAYCLAFNEQAGELFTELIAIRNQIARSCGYPSYAEYGYAAYDRDYSTADTALLGERIRNTIVPLFTSMQTTYYEAWMRLTCGTFYRDVTAERVQLATARILAELNEPWTYMTEHGMYDLGSGKTRMQGSYTTYFASYGAPFLFISWDNSYSMPTTLLHEFGHYASYYFNGQETFGNDSLDLAEVDSQGLEMLAPSQYDLIFGALADAAETVNLFNALYVIISGSMEDAFQQYAYHTENVTTEQLNREYDRLCECYGLKELGLSAYSWAEIPHTFQSPMYYISYCTGMLAASELYAEAVRDYEAAVDAYRSILFRSAGASFRATVTNAGLSDPFDRDSVNEIAEIIKCAFENNIEGNGSRA